MRNLGIESSIQHIVDHEDASIPQGFPGSPQGSMSDAYYDHYTATLRTCNVALDELAPKIRGRKREAKYLDQLRDYVHRLAGVRPAYTLEEQFNHLYTLRKWIFYVPAILLRNSDRDPMTLAVIAHFYAVALSMDDLFPTVAPVFLSSLASTPLKEIVGALGSAARSGNPSPWEHCTFPRNAVSNHIGKEKTRRDRLPRSTGRSTFEGFQQHLAYSMEPSMSGHRSPAFGQFPVQPPTPSYSSTGSTFLEVPDMLRESSQNYQSTPSSLPSMSLSMEPEDLGYDLEPAMDLPGGFVPSPSQALWT